LANHTARSSAGWCDPLDGSMITSNETSRSPLSADCRHNDTPRHAAAESGVYLDER
jgi:hypothetical protein